MEHNRQELLAAFNRLYHEMDDLMPEGAAYRIRRSGCCMPCVKAGRRSPSGNCAQFGIMRRKH